MKKRCKWCNTEVDSEARFCPNCGGTEFVESAQNQMPYSMQGQIPDQPKKKLKWWQIFIIVWCVIGAIISVVTVTKIEKDMETSYDIDEDLLKSALESLYTKGEVVDGVYQNEWANVQFEMMDNWPEGDEGTYTRYENDTTEWGFVSSNRVSGRQFGIFFEELPSQLSDLSEDEYLDAYMKSMQSSQEMELNYDISDKYDTIIAGETYRSIKVEVEGLRFDSCIRIKDGYAIGIICSSTDASEIEETFSAIQPLNEE